MTLPRSATGPLTRVATAVVAVPLFVWLVVRGPEWLFAVIVLAVSAAATWELARMFEHAGAPTYGWFGVVATVAVTASFATALSAPILALAVAAVLSGPIWLPRRPTTVEPVALTLLGMLYVGWFLGHAILLRGLVDGPALVLFLVGVTWIGETGAYAVGSTVGRHKLAPLISPNKTIEGAVAQFVLSVLGGLALAAWLMPDWAPVRAAGAGAVLGVVGQIGDLAESAMKRSVGVKDTGGLVPGHGGLLDRMDSLLFNAPILYYYVTLGGGV
jgi:phosphatidate cytidylyltransferase